MSAPRDRIPVAVLGATGAVGQAFIRLLQDHPWFDLVEVAASERSAGKRYRDAARWIGEGNAPESIASRMVLACDPAAVSAPIVFSALDSSVAGEAEAAFARAGRFVVSNAKNYRMERDVPLVVAEVNPTHLDLIEVQRKNRGWKGAIVTNGNCSTIVAVLALAPLHERYRLKRLFVTTLQAVSGAGYPGVPSLDILGNVVPFIREEEEKLETESRKMLGVLSNGAVSDASFGVSAHCNRVAVENGHTICISAEFETQPSPEDAIAALGAWRGAEDARTLPSSPAHPVIVTLDEDRPQPRRDVNAGGGHSVVVGRVRKDALFGLKMVAMGHNVVRGAAGAALLNAELLVARGMMNGL
ncbi:MAG: aspartate-semialdehyde dehydrogenase [Gemmatimonadetes bacterium]|nr:aspartate-semialdehyde dehydrogenase [Gemmatimonadota bacterium]